MRFLYDEQIASQPAAVEAALGRPVPRLDPLRPTIFAGIGTSLHACRIAASWLPSARALDAHELTLRLLVRPEDQVVIVSHRGTKTWPGAALEKARKAGAKTVAVIGEGAPEPQADLVLRTCPDERAGTHTVSYLTALATLGKLCGVPLDGAPELLRATLALPAPVEAARRIARRDPVLVTGFGDDAVTAAEAALKLKEATFVWAEGMAIELALHGPPAAMRPGMAAIALIPAEDDGGRTAMLRALCADLSVELLTWGVGEELPFHECDRFLRPLISIVPLQRLCAEIARLAGGDPDTIHRQVEPWRSAMGKLNL